MNSSKTLEYLDTLLALCTGYMVVAFTFMFHRNGHSPAVSFAMAVVFQHVIYVPFGIAESLSLSLERDK